MKLIPIVFAGSILASLFGLGWYEALSSDEKRRADAHAAKLAQSLYDQAVSELTQQQLNKVMTHVKRLMGY